MHVNLARVEQFLFRLQDPYNNSSIAIYVNPLMKKMVQGEPTKTLHKRVSCHISDDKSCKPQAHY